MASDWIKLRTGLLNHPKVVRIASALKADRKRVVGALYAAWCLFDEHTVDGLLVGYTIESLDDSIGWRGFGAAMEDVEWLEVAEDGLHMPRFESHNGVSAKRRAQEADRKRTKRGHTSASDADKPQTECGPEKERERDKTTPSLRSGVEVARASRLPDSWEPPEELIAWALTERPAWTREHVLHVGRMFRDHWIAKPGKDGRKLEWVATWRNWVRKERGDPAKTRLSLEERNLDAVRDWQPPPEVSH